MDSHEIEQLVSEAIANRPTATSAPLNLYIHKNRVICGARVVMPKDAAFVAHLSPHQLSDKFNDSEWRSIIEEIRQIAGAGTLTIYPDDRSSKIKTGAFGYQKKSKQPKGIERRSEIRLPHRAPVHFADTSEQELAIGKMRDVSSGGMSFTSRAGTDYLQQGSQITTHFTVPRYNPDKSFDRIKFTRTGSIRRVDKIEPQWYCVALQFAKSLPFKPAEDQYTKSGSTVNAV